MTGRIGRVRPTGSGWMLLVLSALPVTGLLRESAVGTPTTAALIIALLLVSALGILPPVVAVRRVRISPRSPSDAMVGDEVPVELTLRGHRGDLAVRLLDPTGDWHRIHADERVMVGHRARHRGVFDHIGVEVRSTAPLGIFEARALVPTKLPRPIHIAPRPLAVGWRPGSVPEHGTEARMRPTRGEGEVTRTVREYVAGDPARLVHWPTSARTGELVVRELEPPEPIGQAIVCDLTDLGEQTEAAASYAIGACLAVLRRGGRLMLSTRDADGPTTAEVHDATEAGRRLAAAVGGPPGRPPEGWPIVEIGR